MSAQGTAEVAIVGAGVAGLLLARELVRGGREVLVVERGGLKPHAEQVRDDKHTVELATTAYDHEPHPDTPDNEWDFVYGVGGTALHWGGNAPRLMPADFELRSRYGVGRDWPLSYADLERDYEAAERALAIAGGPNPLFGERFRPPLPPHPLAPVDRLLREPLGPYYALPQARPTRSVGGRPPCCGSGRCGLCAVDARYSPLHTLGADLDGRPGFRLQTGTMVARLRTAGGGWTLECIGADGERTTVSAPTVVIAANGVGTAGLLLRSRLGGAEAGRWLGDHRHVTFRVEFPRPVGAGEGASIATGISYAWADGDFRAERGSLLAYPDNRGAYMGHALIDAVAAGRRGRALQASMAERFSRTVVIETIAEDLPHEGRRVELSPRRGRLGLPLHRLRYPADSPYVQAAWRRFGEDLEGRVRPLGGRLVSTETYRGGHQLGTAFMGERDGVTDAEGRVRGAGGLYVAGGATFPTYSAAHPTLTIAALAIRLGRRLAREA